MRLLIPIMLSSFFLNAFFTYAQISVHDQPELGWSLRAAVEAEAVASIHCSGHGRTYLDSPVVDGQLICECNNCYDGTDCSLLLLDCPADAESGDPTFLEAYWRRHQASSAVVVSGWHRMSYYTTGNNYISLELERHIRLLHQAVGNAVTENRYIIFGAGSTQLLNAAVHALSPDTDAPAPASVVASAPYYSLYKSQTSFFNSKKHEWKGVTSNWLDKSSITSDAGSFIELVTSPSNPEGLLQQSVISGSATIHDHAYYWPHFSAINPAPADEGVMLFSGSKFSGHASSRFGWALIKDEKVYKNMVQYLTLNTVGVSGDTQLRFLQILKAILKEIDGEEDMFRFGYNTQSERWGKLNKVISLSTRFSLQELSPHYCSYFKRIMNPSPAYGWLKCEKAEDKNCTAVLSDAGIISLMGTVFEADARYTRLSLIKTEDDFAQLLLRFKDLVSK